ncbi:MAG: ProQ/FinO family protein [Legionellaceae bacterium]|nr:ProQ/FinO family protein [Legionellaceae bacterium]
MNQHNTPQHERQEALNWLLESFSAAFFPKVNQVKPLKLGIYEDIIDFYERLEHPPFSKKMLREALNYYSVSKAYLNCQKENAIRVDLFGNEAELVTKEQAEYAQLRLQERYSGARETTK